MTVNNNERAAASLMGIMRTGFIALMALLCVIVTPTVHAQTASEAIGRGVAWLSAQFQADGSVVPTLRSQANDLQLRAEAALTLKEANALPSSLASSVVNTPSSMTEYLARQIMVASLTGAVPDDLLTRLLAAQNLDGGFGATPGFESAPLDTAFALTALSSARVAAAQALLAANYLRGQQRTDGSWAMPDAVGSEWYVSALALRALWLQRFALDVSAPMAAGQAFLTERLPQALTRDTALGAQVLIAIAPLLRDNSGLASAVTALVGAQATDGSWNGDPYTTALALRALRLASLPSANPDLGSVTMRVVNGATGTALEGAAVSLAGREARTFTTTASGLVEFTGLLSGNYEVSITRASYGALTSPVQLQPGQSLALGTIALVPVTASTTATVRGIVTDAKTGAALSGVSVVVGSRSATTNTSGAYEITAITPGDISIRASRSGYLSALASANVVAGQTVIFSPALVPSASVVTTLAGVITSRATNAPIANASVQITGATSRTVATDNAGRFSVTGLNAGDTVINVSAAGFVRASTSFVVEPSSSYDFSPALEPQPPTTTVGPSIRGQIRDALTGNAIADATVVLSDANTATARTDATGRYQFDVLSPGRTLVSISAPGYQAFNGMVTLENSVAYEISREIFPEGYVDPAGSIVGVVVDENNLRPLAGAVVNAELDVQTRLFALTQADGRFSLPGGLQGTWRVTIGRDGYVDAITDAIISVGSRADLGTVRLKRRSDVVQLPDLIVSQIDRSALTTDPINFRATGVVRVQVSNVGNAGSTQGFSVWLYLDVNRDGRFSADVDTVVGTGRINDSLAQRAFGSTDIPVDYIAPFRDAPFRVLVDADSEIVELDNSNNGASSADVGICR